MLKCDFNATLLKLYFDMGVLLSICCILPKHLFLRTLLNGCLWKVMITYLIVNTLLYKVNYVWEPNARSKSKKKKQNKTKKTQNKAKQNKTSKIKQI